MQLVVLLAWIAALCLVGCGKDGGGGGELDASTDTDSDSDTDAGPDEHYRWHTFYGFESVSADSTVSYDIEVDESGNLYVTGDSRASWDGPGGESPLHAYSGQGDVFVLKLDSDGAYQWHTFYGGSVTTDSGRSLVFDESGNIVVAGLTAASWNGPGSESPLHAHSGGTFDLFVLELSSDGAYQWHTFLGDGSGSTWGNSIVSDASGALYLTGFSEDSWNGPSGESPLHAFEGSDDRNTCVVALDSDGAYQWHTFYGSSDNDVVGGGIAIGATGNVVVVGGSMSSWNGPSGEGPLHAYSGAAEAFILSLDASGGYQWHTFYGCATQDGLNSVFLDGEGYIFATGFSNSTWTGPSAEPPIHAHADCYYCTDILVLALDSAGTYQWHTFFGGGDWDYSIGAGIVPDGSGGLLISGGSDNSWDGPSGEEPAHAFAGESTGESEVTDAFVLSLTGSGAYGWHTFYGCDGYDEGYAIAVDGAGGIFASGYARGEWLGPSGEGPLHAYSGGWQDLFVLALGI